MKLTSVQWSWGSWFFGGYSWCYATPRGEFQREGKTYLLGPLSLTFEVV